MFRSLGKMLMVGLCAVILVGLFAACGGNNGAAPGGSEVMELRLAHNLGEDHPLHVAVVAFAQDVYEGTDGNVNVSIFPNAMLGTDIEVLQQLQTGVIDLTRVGAASLESFSEVFSAFTVPFLFEDQEHFYRVMEGEVGQRFFDIAADDGLLGLTFYDGGARSFYTNIPIHTPDDLVGLNVRVMDNPASVRMMQLLGGSAVPMAFGDIYTALQQGVIDGAENNPTALTLSAHGEVSDYFSLTEHLRIPDFLIISTAVWEQLSTEYQQVFRQAAARSTEVHSSLWAAAQDEAIIEAQGNMDVTIIHPDRAPFQQAVAPMLDELSPPVREIADAILAG